MIEFLPVIILILSFVILLILGVPVAWSIAISSLLTLMVAMPFSAATTTISQRIATGLDSFALLAIPFFILSGQIMSRGGIANRLISFAKTLVGFLPGGLALINIVSAMLMGSIAGAQADPGKRRQLSQIFADVQQVAVGQAAELRSQEQIAAENRLVQLYQQQGTQEVSIALAKLAAEKEKAFLQGNLDQAREIAIMESNMTRVATQASLDRDVRLANLETKKNLLIKNGDYALATRMQNLQKEIVISTTNAEIALKSRSMDDALAMAQFMADQGLEGMEVQIELAEMDARLKEELAKLGYDTQEKIAALDRNQRMVLAEMNAAMQRSANNQNAQNAIIGAVATVAGAWLTSDRRAKKKIKPAKTKAQEFLDSLKAYSYEYKDPDQPGAKHGEMLGIMAQDLEKTSLGKQMVLDTPTGKMVDMGQGLAALLASQAYLNDQVKNLAARI